jgi:hypothetical protein
MSHCENQVENLKRNKFSLSTRSKRYYLEVKAKKHRLRTQMACDMHFFGGGMGLGQVGQVGQVGRV